MIGVESFRQDHIPRRTIKGNALSSLRLCFVVVLRPSSSVIKEEM